MDLKCNKCGNTSRFLACQIVSGTINVIVNGDGNFIENTTEDNSVPEGGLNYDDPEGPYECEKCGSSDIEGDES